MGYILSRISVSHLNILFLLGLALFGGTIGGRVFQRLRIPTVVGYITIGILIGESGLKVVSQDVITSLQPFSYFALGLIGFIIGGSLKKEVLLKYGKQFINILLTEGIFTFLTVSVFIGLAGMFLFKDWRISWTLGLLLGAISSATDPAATSEVLREYKTRGPLTRIVLGIVALDDGLALVLFAIASSIAGTIIHNMQGSMSRIFIHSFYEIGGAVGIGWLGGLALSKFLRKYSEKERLLAFSVGMVLLISGLTLAVNVDMILATMSLGMIAANLTPRKSKDLFKLVEGFAPPIFVLFFVLVGAKVDIEKMSLPIVILIFVYLVGRSVGKAIGSGFGARISGAAKTVQKYIPLSLFSQAGIAIGLSILANNYFPGEIGETVLVIMTVSTFTLEIVGPTFVKIAVTKAGEVGLNITEEDIINNSKVEEFMDKNTPLIYKNMSLNKILNIFSESDNLYYPVVDNNRRLLGIISVESIRNILMGKGLNELLLAIDFMQPSPASISSDSPLSYAKEILDKYNLEYLPVVNKDNVVVGFIERRRFNRLISTKIMELQRREDYLAKSS